MQSKMRHKSLKLCAIERPFLKELAQGPQHPVGERKLHRRILGRIHSRVTRTACPRAAPVWRLKPYAGKSGEAEVSEHDGSHIVVTGARETHLAGPASREIPQLHAAISRT